MTDWYIGGPAILIGIALLLVGFTRLSRTGPRRADATVVSGSRGPKPAWGFLVLGGLILVVGAAVLVLR